MKKVYILILISFTSIIQVDAQEINANLNSNSFLIKPNHFWEKVSYEIGYGYAMPFAPSTNISLNEYNSIVNFQLGANYKFNDQYGFRLTYAYHSFINKNNSQIGVVYNKIMLEVTLSIFNSINSSQKYKQDETFDVIAHGGFGGTFTKNKTNNSNEKILNIQLGFKPTYRVNNQSIIFIDVTGVANLSQDTGFNGLKIGEFNNKSMGLYLSTMIGYQFNIASY